MGEIYSLHTFIFPFLWSGKADHKENLDSFISYFENNPYWTDTNWTDSSFISEAEEENWLTLYKEYQYFHPYVRKAIYGYEGGVVRNFRLEPAWEKKDAFYVIKKKEKEYKLHIKSIQLKIYNTEVALFIMQCENDTYKSLEDVKNINDYGRRIYAPFIAKNNMITADILEVRLPGFKDSITENFEDLYKKYEEEKKANILLVKPIGMIRNLLGFGDNKIFVGTPQKTDDQFYIYPAMDDRMFVMCAVSDKKAANKMKYAVTYPTVMMESSTPIQDESGQLSHLYELFLTQYFQMLCLCLAQRASLIRFNRAAEECSVKLERNRFKRKTIAELLDIQERFVRFQSQLCFEEVTSQERGIEIFGMMKSALSIDKELEATKDLIGNLYGMTNTALGYRASIIGAAAAPALILAALVIGVML
jgi:hypothetical protein